MAPAALAATQAAVCGSSRLRRPWQPRSAELQGAARTAGEYSAPASQARRRWRPACAGTAGWRRGADSEGHGGGPTTSRGQPQRGLSAAAGAMSGRRTLGRGRARASRAASRARAPSRAARGPQRGREKERRERRAGMALFSSLPDSSSPPLPQPPSPPPPRGSSPAEPRPPADLTLYCDPRGGGVGRGRTALEPHPPNPGPAPPCAGPAFPGWGEGAPRGPCLGAAPAAGCAMPALGSANLQAEAEGQRSLSAQDLSDRQLSELLQDITFPLEPDNVPKPCWVPNAGSFLCLRSSPLAFLGISQAVNLPEGKS